VAGLGVQHLFLIVGGVTVNQVESIVQGFGRFAEGDFARLVRGFWLDVLGNRLLLLLTRDGRYVLWR
jgi:hypothetical protein